METLMMILLIIVGGAFIIFFGGIIILFHLALGWIFILIVWISPELSMSFSSHSVVEATAAWAMLGYALIGGFVVIVWGFTAYTKDDLPPFLIGFAWLFPHPAQQAINQGTGKNLQNSVPAQQLKNALLMKPLSGIGHKIHTYQFGKMSEKLRKEKRWAEGQGEVAREAVYTNIAKGEAQELQKAAKGRSISDAVAEQRLQSSPKRAAPTVKNVDGKPSSPLPKGLKRSSRRTIKD